MTKGMSIMAIRDSATPQYRAVWLALCRLYGTETANRLYCQVSWQLRNGELVTDEWVIDSASAWMGE